MFMFKMLKKMLTEKYNEKKYNNRKYIISYILKC